ncbi:MAG: hypothetical protein ACYSW1_20295, partial [Planctomycetota bacterium]
MEPDNRDTEDLGSAHGGSVKARHRFVRIIALVITWLLAGVVIALLTVVADLFLYVGSFPWAVARLLVAVAFVLVVVGLFVFIRPRWK